MTMTARVNHKKSLYRGRVFDFTVENITLENGVTCDLDIIRHPGASAIVPFSDRETVILLKQYRHSLGGYIWEIPAGTFDPDEAPLACARRELSEETGFKATRWEKLGEITPVPGYSDERVHIFLALGLSASRQKLDVDEMLDVHPVGIDQALEMISTGEIQDAKTIVGLYLAVQRQRG